MECKMLHINEHFCINKSTLRIVVLLHSTAIVRIGFSLNREILNDTRTV